MPILVICPGCKTNFSVSDKFAGKKGPCPKCKTVITIPAVTPEVKIHGPDEGPKTAEGRPIFQPIARVETKLTPIQIFAIVAACVGALVVSVMVRFGSDAQPPAMFLAIGALVLGPPLAFAGYTFLRDQEMTPFPLMSLLPRVAICGVCYALLWGAYAYVPQWAGIVEPGQPLSVFVAMFAAPLLAAAGGLAAFASLDLEYTTSMIHYALYLVVTIFLLTIAGGLGYLAELPKPKPTRPGPRRPRAAVEQRDMDAGWRRLATDSTDSVAR